MGEARKSLRRNADGVFGRATRFLLRRRAPAEQARTEQTNIGRGTMKGSGSEFAVALEADRPFGDTVRVYAR